MAKLDVLLTPRQYDPDLCMLRKVIVLDRKPQLSEVVLRTEYGNAVTLFIDHQTLYVIAIDCGAGPWRIPDAGFPDVPGARTLEFGGNYNDLCMHLERIELSAGLLEVAVRKLSFHRPGAKGSDFMLGEKQDLIRLIFVVSEALRFWTIQRDVSNLLKDPAKSLYINDYAGSDKPLNSWGTWSERINWPDKGIFVPKIV